MPNTSNSEPAAADAVWLINDEELRYGLTITRLDDGLRRCLSEIIEAPTVVERPRQAVSDPLFVRPGHYYFARCNVEQFSKGAYSDRFVDSEKHGIELNRASQRSLFTKLATHFFDVHFPNNPHDDYRYYCAHDFFNIGDAMILSNFIRKFQPKRIAEIGSGFLGAVPLDTLDSSAKTNRDRRRDRCTFFESYAERLRHLLWKADYEVVEVLEADVQAVDVSPLASLEPNDIVFFDTTHIVETCSDVVYELFDILSLHTPGVVIRSHDFFCNFEYPREWIVDEYRSWNEIYAVRTFLLTNNQSGIRYFNHQFATRNTELVKSHHRDVAAKPGGGLKLRRC